MSGSEACRRRRSISDSTPPRLVACVHSRVGRRDPLGTLGAAGHLDRDDRAEAGVADPLHARVAGQASREVGRVGAGALDPQVHGAHAPQGQPGLHRSGDRAVDQPVVGQPLVRGPAGVGVRGHGGAEDDVGVPGEELGHRVHHHVGSQRQRLLAEGSGEGVVADHGRALLVSGRDEGRQVGHLQHRVGRGLRPEQVRPLQGRGDGRGVTDVDPPYGHPPGGGEVLQDHPGAVVGVGRRDDDAAFGGERQGRGDRCHARGEHQRRATLERPERVLERRPGRVAATGVVDRAVGDVRRGQLQGRVDPGSGHARLAAGRDQDRGGGEVIGVQVVHAHRLGAAPARVRRRPDGGR